jgi:acetolactate synthase small subunit
LFIALGKKDNITEEALKDFVVQKGGLAADVVGRIAIKFDFSVVDVPPEQVTALVGKLHNQMVGELQARVEPKQRRSPDRAPREGGDRGPRRRRPRGEG